jgi:hypothetical protein
VTESNQVHLAARRALHAPPAMLYLRCNNALAKGWPDATYCLLGVAGMVEEKLLPGNGGVPAHLTLDQIRWGEAWTAAGGLWHLLGKRGGEWRLYSVFGARRFYDGVEDSPVLARHGLFPSREVLAILSPVEMRRC